MFDYLFCLRRLTPGGSQINALRLIERLLSEGKKVAIYVDGQLGSLQYSMDARAYLVRNKNQIYRINSNCIVCVDPFFYKDFLRLKLKRRQTIFLINAQELVFKKMMHSNSYFFVNGDVRLKYSHVYDEKFSNNVLYRGRFPSVSQPSFTLERRRALFIGRIDKDKLDAMRYGLRWLSNEVDELENITFIGDGACVQEVMKFCKTIFGEKVLINFEGWVSDPSSYFSVDTFVLGMASSIQLALHHGQDAVVIGESGYVSPVSSGNFETLDKCHFNVHQNINMLNDTDEWESLNQYNMYCISDTTSILDSYKSDIISKSKVLSYIYLFYHEKSLNYIRSRFSLKKRRSWRISKKWKRIM